MLRRVWIPVTGVSWRDITLRIIVMNTAFMLYGFAIAMMVDAQIGAAPWDVLSVGVTLNTPLTFGLATAAISVAVLLLWIPLRQKVGLGSLLNGLTIGPWADVGFMFTFTPDELWQQFVQFGGGIVILAFATAMYISADYGPGPRDGLMTGLTRVLGWPLWITRTLLEVSVVIIGWMLGGPIGAGTVAFALLIGPLVQWFLPWWRRGMQWYRLRETRRLAARRGSGPGPLIPRPSPDQD